MRHHTILILIIIILIMGCSAGKTEKYNVTLQDAAMEETKTEDNRTVDLMSFTLRNNEDFPLDCAIITEMSNKTNETSARSEAGALEAGEAKKITLKIAMLGGETELNIRAECERI